MTTSRAAIGVAPEALERRTLPWLRSDLGHLRAVGGVRRVGDELDIGLSLVVSDAVEPLELALDLGTEPVVQLQVAGRQVRLQRTDASAARCRLPTLG